MSTAPAPAADASRCPLCGQANLCAMEAERASGLPQGTCWCTQVDFTAELLGNVPDEAAGLACVCAACAKRATAR